MKDFAGEFGGSVCYRPALTLSARPLHFPILFFVAVVTLSGCEQHPGEAPIATEPVKEPAGLQYVGSAECSRCHQAEFSAWQSSHHYLAMQPATPETVLADFDNVSLSEGDEVTTFNRQEAQFHVQVASADDSKAPFTVTHTFGADPLQQYLVPTEGGRLQALTLAWDSRDKGEGGGRWFSLQNETNLTDQDPFHWTGVYYNWNHQCADCHVTGYEKHYDRDSNTYESTWAEGNVSCEACHGPGSNHLNWLQDDTVPDKGFGSKLGQQPDIGWSMAANATVAAPQQSISVEGGSPLVETCAPCHSRRSLLDDNEVFSKPLADTHRIRTLDPGLYHPDGQILDEVYVYGSFVQSKMYAAGVTCSNCHDPHSAQLKAPGAEVCLTCHAANTFDTPEHHRHQITNPSVSPQNVNCVSCHMPSKTYMGVDNRHDHSFRIPRPDLTATIGVPNTCNSCHDDKTPEWAATQIRDWSGKVPQPHFGATFAQADRHDNRARDGLLNIIEDGETPGIVRASAIRRLDGLFDGRHVNLVRVQLRDKDPLVRREAVQLLAAMPGDSRLQILAPILLDPALDVRLAAVVALANIPSHQFSNSQLASFNKVLEELERSRALTIDRADTTTEQASVYASMGLQQRAEALFKRALTLEPTFVPASINLADMYRQRGDDESALAVLQQAAISVPDSAAVQHAMGLALVRQGRSDRALPLFGRASELDPNNPYYVLVNAIAINSTGRQTDAIVYLTDAMNQFPYHTDITRTLAMFHRDAGNLGAAMSLANRLDPMSPQTRNLISDLQNRQMLERYQ